jgi:soluble lytic murein transglycosylase
MQRPSENIPILRPFCGISHLAKKFAGRSICSVGVVLLACLVFAIPSVIFAAPNPDGPNPAVARVRSAAKKPAPAAPTEKQLEQFTRALKQNNSAQAYSRLSAFATQKSNGVLGQRAALALGYFDYNRSHYPDAAKWFDRAKSDPLLRDYSLYWSAENALAGGRNADALNMLSQFRKDYPDSVLTDQVFQSLAQAAISSNHPADAIAALNAYALTPEKPDLLFLRGEAREQSGQGVEAASDYLSIYLRYPTTERAREAGLKLSFLRSTLGDKIPTIPPDQRTQRATLLYVVKNWAEARNEYSQLLPQLSGDERERAELRILECGVALGAGPSEMKALALTDPDVDAERFYSLADSYRTAKAETDMVAAVESAVSRAPSSRWAELSLFLAGNYFWVQLDRDRAASYYKRVEENFPTSPNAIPAHWRVAWVEVLKRQPDAPELLAEHLRRFPGSQFTADALYALGRLAEDAGNPSLARSYYGKLTDRFPQNYFSTQALPRLRALGPGPVADADVLSTIPPPPPALTMGDSIPAAAAERQARADALRSIAFDASAELELRAAYASTGESRLLFEAAQAAVNASHFGAAIVTIRQIFPQLENRTFTDVPHEVWLTSYPIPYQDSIRHWSAKAGLDPMLVAALIRQESAFSPEAHSSQGALGLMQLEPKTARLMAKQSKLRYSQAQLFNPDYNIHLGTVYVSNLLKQFGSVEAALGAYDGGEDHVQMWTAGQNYRDRAEFVDSIPFTETREYIEIITRNADIYRRLYGAQPDEPRKAGTSASNRPSASAHAHSR